MINTKQVNRINSSGNNDRKQESEKELNGKKHVTDRPASRASKSSTGEGGQVPLRPVQDRILERPRWRNRRPGEAMADQGSPAAMAGQETLAAMAGQGCPAARGGQGSRAAMAYGPHQNIFQGETKKSGGSSGGAGSGTGPGEAGR